MNVRFINENEEDKLMDKSGSMYFEMDIDTKLYLIDYITNYDEHLDCKPLNKTKRKIS